MNNDLISRSALLKKVFYVCAPFGRRPKVVSEFDVLTAPPVDAAPVLRGRWVLEKGLDGKPYCFHCSVCDNAFRRIDITTAYPYCPYCGAKMETRK